ncbi:large ribosomal subunit protein P1-like [Haematobia irritans]|uniref:large ribosomal subunit protein P1-like n=1 Tax=Haematobia irritans TaxID=7368 RepID=UPI003F4F5AEA
MDIPTRFHHRAQHASTVNGASGNGPKFRRATFVQRVNVKDLITNIGSAVGAAPAGGAAAPAGGAAPDAETKKEEKKKEEEPEESDGDMGFALFD